MGLFSFLFGRGKDERAMPDPGSPEFQQTVAASELPGSSGSLGVEPDQWTSTQQTIDLRGTGAREEMRELLRRNGIDPEKEGQTVDPSQIPGLQEQIIELLKRHGADLDGPAQS
jgi:hypothetical protein